MGASIYERALKAGQKEYKVFVQQEQDPYLKALEMQIANADIRGEEDLGLISIPMERLAGTRNTARRDCFSPSFLPLLDENSEFAAKWGALAMAHLEEGIRDPIKAVEYMNRYYVIEGHKRVSVLRYFGSPTVTGTVVRLLPKESDTPEYCLYQEYLEFYKHTKINYIEFTRQKRYEELLKILEKDDNRPWDFERRREFFADCTRFRRAYQEFGFQSGMERDEALLRYLQIYGYEHLCRQTPSGLQKDMQAILEEFHAGPDRKEPALSMEPVDAASAPGLLRRLIETKPRTLRVAFVHDKSPETSWWTEAHERGRVYAQEQLGAQIETVSFFHALQEDPRQLLEMLAQEDFHLIFTTTPRLLDATLRSAAKYPNVKFLNCSLNTKHPIVRTYYGRMYEAKFLAGMVAGACSQSGHIGYICNYPVFSAPASINAFALGARMVCEHARIHLEWSTVPGTNIFGNFREKQVDMISGHDLYSPDQQRWAAGVFRMNDDLHSSYVVSSWNWGQIYERIISGAIYGLWALPGFVDQKGSAINYWWGLSSKAVEITCSDRVSPATRRMVSLMKDAIVRGKL
ncbi:MAG: BMP family ABC transporter substrate-binding protein, partial [Oscillospiraceae bacterium]|nr:BMP family ABC transporter substrate-binding protein [Oscillospiraceae bacterium]